VDIWDYFIQKERQFGEKSAWPDGEPELRADPDSDGREGFLRATLGMGLTAYVRVFEWITISDQGVPFREIYSYGLVIEEAFAYGWEHDPYTHPECPYRDWWAVSRVGVRVAREPNPTAHLRSAALLDADLHPAIGPTVRSLFTQGQYELAAFEAMRQVEIHIRQLAGANDRDVGTHLMRLAFNPDTGPLVDAQQDKGERQSTSDLFAGAMGTFKNPTSHRQVTYTDPAEASEVCLLADLLLRILDRRATTPKSAP
jgi:uncharacterized protein (TIGR02391 family)